VKHNHDTGASFVDNDLLTHDYKPIFSGNVAAVEPAELTIPIPRIPVSPTADDVTLMFVRQPDLDELGWASIAEDDDRSYRPMHATYPDRRRDVIGVLISMAVIILIMVSVMALGVSVLVDDQVRVPPIRISPTSQ